MKEETKEKISAVIKTITSYYAGYLLGLLGGFSLFLEIEGFGQRMIPTIMLPITVCALIFVNVRNFKRKSELRYGMLMGTIFTGVVTPIFGQFYSETHFMFGYSLIQVVLVILYQVLEWLSYWFHTKIFGVQITDVGLKRWMLIVLFIILDSNLSGLVQILIGSATSIIYGVM